MTFTEQQVETIVLEVIRRLGLLENYPRVAVIERSSTTAELTLTDRVISQRTIAGRLAGVERLVVARRAVVTPAVQDELKKHKIELVRGR